jgi:hypothetical protein
LRPSRLAERRRLANEERRLARRAALGGGLLEVGEVMFDDEPADFQPPMIGVPLAPAKASNGASRVCD